MRFAVILLLLACVSSAITAQNTNGENSTTIFAFNNFNTTETIHQVGSASLQSQAVQLTNHSERLIGRAYYPNPVQMKETDGTVISFNTTFVFAIVPHPLSGGGDGLCFVMTPDTLLHNAIATQYLGLVNTTSEGQNYNHIFAIEFDTIQSIGVADMDGNHVGIDLNSVKSFAATTAGIWSRGVFQSIDLKSGHNIQAWIEYDGDSQQLEVRIAPAGQPRPEQPLLSNKTLNLSGILEKEMYVGFSSSTGSAPLVEDHYILAWSFASGGSPAPVLNILQLPSFYVGNPKFYKSTKFLVLVILFSVLFAVGVSACTIYWLKRTGYIEFYDKWELQFWPHRFPYRDLRLGTKNFREENLLGTGGFGRVYRGVAAGGEVAVKCISRDCDYDGMKEFIAEISSLGRLQHRNLVPLRGWCRKKKRLFIVYDYMPNGSLDRKLHRCSVGLTWAQRYRILKGVAAGVLYLHEQWEKRVVHRDIKPSNILLDSELDGRVGDFGLARLYDHSEKPQTTHVVGTLGYIAPELIQSGKASPSTDVFSFGALMLEVACGRKPVDATMGGDGVLLVQRVWELYARGNLVDAVDPRLGVEYELEEAEIVLTLGLLCCYPEAKQRPSIREVVQILNREAALPAELEIPAAFRSGYGDLDTLGMSLFNVSGDVSKSFSA